MSETQTIGEELVPFIDEALAEMMKSRADVPNSVDDLNRWGAIAVDNAWWRYVEQTQPERSGRSNCKECGRGVRTLTRILATRDAAAPGAFIDEVLD